MLFDLILTHIETFSGVLIDSVLKPLIGAQHHTLREYQKTILLSRSIPFAYLSKLLVPQVFPEIALPPSYTDQSISDYKPLFPELKQGLGLQRDEGKVTKIFDGVYQFPFFDKETCRKLKQEFLHMKLHTPIRLVRFLLSFYISRTIKDYH